MWILICHYLLIYILHRVNLNVIDSFSQGILEGTEVIEIVKNGTRFS